MRLIRIDETGHTVVCELTREQIAAMSDEERQKEIARLAAWANGEIKNGRLVVEVKEPGAEGVQVHKGHEPSLDVFQYESHSPIVGG